jgi:hypothetical protein
MHVGRLKEPGAVGAGVAVIQGLGKLDVMDTNDPNCRTAWFKTASLCPSSKIELMWDDKE